MFELNKNIQTTIDRFIEINMNRMFQRLKTIMNVKLSTNNFSNDIFSNKQSVIDNIFNFDNNNDSRFNSKKIYFFNFHFNDKTSFIDASMKYISDNTMFRDVYLFITRVKNFVDVHDVKLIRKNLFKYLQNDVIDWYFSRLSLSKKRILTLNENLNEWKLILMNEYKKNAIKIMKKNYF